MSTVNDFHPEAMDLAETAFRILRKGDSERAKQLFLQALKLEQQAAALLLPVKEAEPSRSILYRSAASLAYNGGDYETADWLIANGLAGFPPPEIKEELKNLYEDVNFMRHLTAKGMELGNDQWLMTLAGNATAFGSTLVDPLMLRVDRLSTLFYRTIERLLKLPYRTNGGVSKEIKEPYGLYINTFLPSSFAVSFQLGRPSQQLSFPGMEEKRVIEPEVVIDEVLRCFEIMESAEPSALRERFSDEVYYENFVGLAKQIAPDGEDIKVVGFTTIRNGKEKPVALRKSRQQLRETPDLNISDEPEKESIQRSYRGILRFASSPSNRKFGTVKLTDSETYEVFTIKVPIAIMKDVVQPFFEERVKVVVQEKGNEKILEEVALDA